MVTVWCPDWPVVAAGVAGGRAGGRAARQPGRRPLAGGGRRGRRHRPAPPPGPAAAAPTSCCSTTTPTATPGPSSPSCGRSAGSPPASRSSSRAGCASAPAARRATSAATSASPSSSSPRSTGEAAAVERSGLGIGIADGRFAAAVAARRAGRAPMVVAPGTQPGLPRPAAGGVAAPRRRGRPRARRAVRPHGPGPPRRPRRAARPVTSSPASGRPVATPTASPAGSTSGRPAATEPPPERRVEQSFDDPVVQLEPLVFVGKHLADQLVAALAAEGRVCTRVVVTAETEHGERTERAWYRAAGLSAPAMVERVRWQLDAWMTSGEVSAGVVLLRLAPDEVRGDDGDQVAPVGWAVGGRRAGDARRGPAGRDGRRPGRARADVARRAPAGRPLRLGAGVDHRPHRRRRHRRAAPAAAAATAATAGPVAAWPGAGRAVAGLVAGAVTGRRAGRGAARPSCSTPPGSPVAVSGRGELTRGAGDAGRSPVARRWRSPAGPGRGRSTSGGGSRPAHRRLARFQVVTADGAAHLVLAEHRAWWVAATYG